MLLSFLYIVLIQLSLLVITFTIAQSATPTSVTNAQFTVPSSADVGLPILPSINDPEAPNAQESCPGYAASNVRTNVNGLTADLTLAGAPCNAFGTDIQDLKLKIEYQSLERIRINIQPAHLDSSNTSWFILPEDVVPLPSIDSDFQSTDGAFNITWNTNPFSFKVTRKSTGDVVFDTTGSKLVYEDQFIEFVTSMPENYNINGLGERVHQLRLGTSFTATTWASDAGTPLDYGLYGTHPVYLDTRYFEESSSGDWTYVPSNTTDPNANYTSYAHAVYNRNAHGQEVLLAANNITWRLLGGSIDLFLLDGPNAPEAIKNYQSAMTGYPALQQYWTFGYHQCRWGYENWTVLQEVVDTFKQFDIPLETIWTDIDYMDHYKDFTTSAEAFPVDAGQKFISGLSANDQHYIPIVDAAIYINNPENETDRYDTYRRGNASDVFLQNPDGSQYIGSVWPGYTVFLDWHSSNAVSFWVDEFTNWYKDIAFSGIWIDMSEVSSFCVGSCGTGNLSLQPVHPPFLLPGEPNNVDYNFPEGFNITNSTEAASASSASSRQAAATSTSAGSSSSTSFYRSTPTPGIRNINHPPYAINNVGGDLAVHAVSPNATHADGVVEVTGHEILNATYQALLAVFPGKRPFIIGRSTFASSGRFAGHWYGDNNSKWPDMYFSIPQALAFSIFGIPMFGPDTCGFAGNSDEELCNRWMQLSAFFPFYRNHNTLKAASQEPYTWASVIEASKKAMYIRYSLLPYIYTLFYNAHTKGDTVMRALAWEFTNDPSLVAADRQFLLGPALMITPVLNQLANSTDAVFPGIGKGTRWFDWYTGTEVDAAPGENVTVPAPLGHIPVFVRSGHILPTQQPGLTTTISRKGAWSLIAALDGQGAAIGEIYLDDGESLEPNATKLVTLSAGPDFLSANITGNYQDSNPLASISIWGLANPPINVSLNGADVTSKSQWNSTSLSLIIAGLRQETNTGAWTANWTLKWT